MENILEKTKNNIKEKGISLYFNYFLEFSKSLSNSLRKEILNQESHNPLDIENLSYYLTQTQIQMLEAILKKLPFKSCSTLLGMGFSPMTVEKIVTFLGTNEFIYQIEQNPYILLEVEEISFKKIDKIALSLFNIPKNFPERQKAIINYHLNFICDQQGHLFYPVASFFNSIKEDISRDSFKQYYSSLIEEKKIIQEGINIYPAGNYVSEKESAKILTDLLKDNHNNFFDEINSDEYIKGYEEYQTKNIINGRWNRLKWLSNQFQLSEEQKQAIKYFFKYRFFVITGLPGTGKTTVLKALVDICKRNGLNICLMCPTGIAAKKLSNVCGYDASTIHKTLQFDGVFWHKDEEKPLDYDVIIIDEFSMVDQKLLYRLLRARPQKKFALVFVGDSAQLPSVAPGSVLRELANNENVPHIKLTKIFRQEDTSDIILNAHLINRGEINLINKRGDFLFEDIRDHKKILEKLVNVVSKLKETQFQVLSPTYNGILGVTNINNTLQDILNPIEVSTKYFDTLSYKFRTKDRVMIIKNDYLNEIYNGEQGTLVDISESERKIQILINNKIIDYRYEDAYKCITLDYARTIHRVQSQEYDYIVMPLIDEFSIQLQRNLIYTAITRAKNKVIILGHGTALVKAIKNNEVIKRNTKFSSKISFFMGEK